MPHDDQPIHPLPYGRERAQIARLLLALTRTSRNAIAPHMTLHEWSEYIAIGCQVLIGHAQGKPQTASQIARFLEMPRATVLRRLKALATMGILTRIGTRYYLGNAKAITHEHVREHLRNLRVVCVELFNLDENITTTGGGPY